MQSYSNYATDVGVFFFLLKCVKLTPFPILQALIRLHAILFCNPIHIHGYT